MTAFAQARRPATTEPTVYVMYRRLKKLVTPAFYQRRSGETESVFKSPKSSTVFAVFEPRKYIS
jgi:hypothetical protein